MRQLIEPKFSDRVTEEIDTLVIQQITTAEQGNSMRDDFLIQWNDMLEGNLPPQADRFPGASNVDDPICRDSHTMLLAMLDASLKRSPLWLVDSYDPADAHAADEIEAWLTMIKDVNRLSLYLHDLSYITLRDGVGILYCGWKQKMTKTRYVRYVGEDGIPVDAESRLPGMAYKETHFLREEVIGEGLDLRTPDLADFYTFPSNAFSIEHAIGVGERIFLTEQDLREGIEEYGYDPHAVQQLIDRGPGYTQFSEDFHSYIWWRQGVETGSTMNQTMYPVFQWFCKLPRSHQNDDFVAETEPFYNEDMMFVVDPASKLVLKRAISPFQKRPYIPFYILRMPNSLIGWGVPKLLESIQAEANANLQYTIDSMNFEMAPVLKVLKSSNFHPEQWKIFPGATIRVDDMNDVQPFQWQMTMRDGIAMQGFLENRARAITATENFGVLSSKVRKSAEIEQALTTISSKFNMFLSNFQIGLEELAVRIVELYLNYTSDLQQEFMLDGEMHHLSHADLRRKFRYMPNGSADDANPQSRFQKAQIELELIRNSPLYQLKIRQGDMSMEYRMLRKALTDLGERNTEELIGKIPPPPQPVQGGSNAGSAIPAAPASGGPEATGQLGME